MGLKSVSEALALRNQILTDFEKAIQVSHYESRQQLIDIVIVGGGPTGVELAGSLAEMKKYILPKDYHELNHKEVDIYLIQGANRLLVGMDEGLAKAAENYLRKMGVKLMLSTRVTDIKDGLVMTNKGDRIEAKKVIWAAGVTCEKMPGLDDENMMGRGARLKVDGYSRLKGFENVFVLGDAACMETEAYPKGHPQVAQPAIQQAKNLSINLAKYGWDQGINDQWKPFKYKDLGTMATVGRNKAVVELPYLKFKGFLAWMTWLFVHLYALVGVRNRVIVLMNWIWSYFTYDHSLRLIIRPKKEKGQESRET